MAQLLDRGSPEELKLALMRAINHARASSLEVGNLRLELDRAEARIRAMKHEINWLKRRGVRFRARRLLVRMLPSRLKKILSRVRAKLR